LLRLVAAAIITAAMVTCGGLSWLLQRLLSACTPQSRGNLPGGPNRIATADGHSQIGSAVTQGETVLVLGTTDSTTITATQVIVQPAGSSRSAPSSAATVIPFKRGTATVSKQAGQIPADYSQGSGTIVSGTAANKATEAALAAYPGGIVDRVVQLSNGEYEVHNIGVNWPHHVFVNENFKVIGAE
jgi:hypothetical protein